MKVGVESAHSFGDTLFNAPLVKALSEKYSQKIGVAVRPHCADGYKNLDFVSEIVHINNINEGQKALHAKGYDKVFQITQNSLFFEYKQQDPNHSLIDTPTKRGKELGVTFDPKPLFKPTDKELEIVKKFKSDIPTIAIESVYKSAQSWAQKEDIGYIVGKHLGDSQEVRILWLSNEGAPRHPQINNMLQYSRRECIMALSACDTFFSVGSGFFCASLALAKELQPKKIVCLWKDDLYRYENRLSKTDWHGDITWVHNRQELAKHLK